MVGWLGYDWFFGGGFLDFGRVSKFELRVYYVLMVVFVCVFLFNLVLGFFGVWCWGLVFVRFY